jgi:hypothetical protein
MRAYPVSTRVNQVQNDDAECATPVRTCVASPDQGALQPGMHLCSLTKSL